MFNNNTTLVGQANERLHIAEYMVDSLDTFERESIWGKLLYKEEIKAVDSLTGAAYKKTIKFAKPQGAGGVGEFSKGAFQRVEQPGNIGMMIPSGEQITIGTSFKYTTIGRTWQDKLRDNTGLYEAIKNAQMGKQITGALEEMTKAAIYSAAEKTLAGGTEGDDFATQVAAVTAETAENYKLTWQAIKDMVISKETYLVQMRNNHERANDAFRDAVRTVTTTPKGESADTTATAKSVNLVDMDAWTKAQEAFSAAWRTERWATPRYSISGISAGHYKSDFVSVAGISIGLPDLNTLYSQELTNQMSPMLVLVGNSGYRQLFNDEEFQAALAVSGFKYDTGMSGRYQEFIPAEQAINVQGILIVNMQQNEMKIAAQGAENAILGGGVSYGDSINANGVSFSTAFTAVPGFNFITRATEGIGTNGIRVTNKKFSDVDLYDRFGFHEFTNMLFAWDVVIADPTTFAIVAHAE